MRSRKVALLVSLALLLSAALAAQLPQAGAQAGVETTVILIEVDGLEPKDVTRETTPFLWELAHPNAPESQLIEDSRSGWSWQAPRSVMSAGTAANAEALLTGGYPEQSGVPADEFFDPDSGETMRLEHQGDNPLPDGAFQIRNDQLVDSNTLLALVAGDDTERDRDAAAFVGNPALSGIVAEDAIPDDLKWWPANEPSQSPPSPAYCDLPRRMPEDPETEGPDPSYQPPCSATDLVTLDHAANQLGSKGGNVAFSYIHLAELGVIKRRDGDFSRDTQIPPTDVESPEAAQSVPHQLAQTDAAIAQFIARYKDQNASPATWQKWPNTFVFVVGSHGYETSSPDKRLPAPGGHAGVSDLESWVESQDGALKYSGYGSMATIHVDGDAGERRTAVAGLVDDLKPGGTVDQACGEPCIEELLYVDKDVMPATVPEGTGLLSERHPDWHLDHMNLDEDGNRTVSSRRSGELIIVTKPGWGAGAVVSAQQEGLTPDVEAPDPYIGVAGGPRNRAVAAIVNGPGGDSGVRQVVPRRYPVTTATGNCQSPDPNPTPKYASAAEANAHPEDDTEEVGHECQPENVDFAPTIGALLQVGIDDEQLGGRFLQEAFLRPLAFPGIEELEEPPPPPPPPPATHRVVVLPAPAPPRAPRPPRTWRYSGLIRNVLAAVGDRSGDLYPDVRRGASLDYLILRADFGKPLAAVKLTFYRRVEASASASRRTVVKTLATFKPFTVRRARHADLKLKVPELFEPTHVGVVVQRARPLTRAERIRAAAKRDEGEDVPDFKAYGAQAGGIYRIRKAHRLHTRATRVRKPDSRN